MTDLLDRILSRIEPDTNGGCWLWTGAHMRGTGYGSIQTGSRRLGGQTIGAHRASWIAHRGPIPAGIRVLHRCDVRLCVNPAHLFLGTAQDNMQDMLRKGRGRPIKGSAHSQAKLTEKDIPGIRIRLSSGEPCSSIASDFGVDQCAINAIRRGRTWKHA